MLLLGAVAVAGVVLVVWPLLGGPSMGGAGLGRLPEAELRYPGSESLRQGSFDRVDDWLGTTSAAWWHILGTDAAIDEVEAFYRGELAGLGWGDGRPDARATDEVSAVDWHRENLRIRVSFKETEEWYQSIEGSDRFPTLYELRIIEVEP